MTTALIFGYTKPTLDREAENKHQKQSQSAEFNSTHIGEI